MTQQILAIIDTETTGVDESAVATEKAVIIYDATHGTQFQFSGLCPGVTQRPDGGLVSGISQEALDAAQAVDDYVSIEAGAALFLWRDLLAESAHFLVAHNAQFDARFWDIKDAPWLCTMQDFQLATPYGKRDLVSIALHHGVPVVSAHRALTDCQLIASIFDKFRADGSFADRLERAIERSKSPLLTVFAHTEYKDREIVKEWRSESGNRFYWNPERRRWEMTIKECDMEALATFPLKYAAIA